MRNRSLLVAPLSAAVLLLPGCGGGGGGGSLASAPPPVAVAPAPAATSAFALPPTPATTSGTYDAIASYTVTDSSKAQRQTLADGSVVLSGPIETVVPQQVAPSGAITLGVDAATRTYTLTATVGPFQFPTDSMTMAASADLGSTRNYPLSGGSSDPGFFSPEARIARGDLVVHGSLAAPGPSGAQRTLTSYLTLFNVGQQPNFPRYLSAASWGQFYRENPSATPGAAIETQAVRGLLVFGQRTLPSEIPISGKARYSLENLIDPTPFNQRDGFNEDGSPVDTDGKVLLDVDFATRQLGATYDLNRDLVNYRLDDFGQEILDSSGNPVVDSRYRTTVHAAGSTLVDSRGSFALMLAGTGSVHAELTDKPPVPDITAAVSGSITGAFFGPQAAEVGGIASLPQIGTDGIVSNTIQAFAGLKIGP